jgi:hypothetical protein
VVEATVSCCGVSKASMALWCNWLTRRPLKAESPGSSPGNATKPAFVNEGLLTQLLAPWCNWLTRGPFKAESPGSSPGGATKKNNRACWKYSKALLRSRRGTATAAADLIRAKQSSDRNTSRGCHGTKAVKPDILAAEISNYLSRLGGASPLLPPIQRFARGGSCFWSSVR